MEDGTTAAEALSVIDDHAKVQGWTAINSRRVETNVHGVSFYKAKPLPQYPTSIWKRMPERDPEEDEILDYDEHEELKLPPGANSTGALSQAIGPSLRGDDSLWNHVPDEELFESDLSIIKDSLLFHLATKYTLKDLTANINAAHNAPIVGETTLRRRLYEQYIPRLANREGKSVGVIRQGIRDAREANGVGGKKRVSSGSDSRDSAVVSASPEQKPPTNTNRSSAVLQVEAESSPSPPSKHQLVLPWLKDQAVTNSPPPQKRLAKKKSTTELKPLAIPKHDIVTHDGATPSSATPSTADLGTIPSTDQSLFDGNPDNIAGATIYDLAIRYSVAEIYKRILLAHPGSDLKQNRIKDRLYKYIGELTKQTGKERGTILNELNKAREAGRSNKKGLKGGFQQQFKRKAADPEDDEPEQTKHEGDAETAESLEMIEEELKKRAAKKKRKLADEPSPPTPATKEQRAVSESTSRPPATASHTFGKGKWSPAKCTAVEVSTYTPSPVKTALPYQPKTKALSPPWVAPETQINDLVDEGWEYIDQDSSPTLAETARSYGGALALDSPAAKDNVSATPKRNEIADSAGSSPLQEISPNTERRESRCRGTSFAARMERI